MLVCFRQRFKHRTVFNCSCVIIHVGYTWSIKSWIYHTCSENQMMKQRCNPIKHSCNRFEKCHLDWRGVTCHAKTQCALCTAGLLIIYRFITCVVWVADYCWGRFCSNKLLLGSTWNKTVSWSFSYLQRGFNDRRCHVAQTLEPPRDKHVILGHENKSELASCGIWPFPLKEPVHIVKAALILYSFILSTLITLLSTCIVKGVSDSDVSTDNREHFSVLQCIFLIVCPTSW